MATATKKYQTYYISDQLRRALAAKRTQHNVTTKAILDAAVTEALPRVTKALGSVGLRGVFGKVRPARWQVDSVLPVLKIASRQTGVPANKLLIAALNLFVQKKGAK